MNGSSSALTSWIKAFLFWVLCIHVVWWWGDLSDRLLEIMRFALGPLVTAIWSWVTEVRSSADGGWQLSTTVTPVGVVDQFMRVPVAESFLGRSVRWVPTTFALVVATSGWNPRALAQSLFVVLLVVMVALVMCVAANLAAAVSPLPSQFDDSMLPRPHGVPLNIEPYPTPLFHLLSFIFYLTVLIGPLAIPVLIWIGICHRALTDLIAQMSAR